MTAEAVAAPVGVGGSLSFGRVLRAEWLKLITLRSNWVMLGLIVLFVAGLGPLFSFLNAHQAFNTSDPDDLVGISQSGELLAQLVAGVFGCLLATNEYATGMIRASFTAVPTRTSVFAAKLIVLIVPMFVLSAVSSFVAFFASVPIDSHSSFIEVAPSISDPGVLRTLFFVALYLSLIAAFGNCLGWLIRNTAGSISTLFGLLFVLPLVLQAIPSHVLNDIEHWTLIEAQNSMRTVNASTVTDHSAPVGLLLMLAYVGVALIGAVWVLVTRDA